MIHAGRKALAFIALLFSATLSMAEVAVPPLESRVTDLTGTLSSDQMARLDQKLTAFEARKGSQIVVLMVPTTAPETIEQYSIRVAEAWKPGRKGVDDGVLLLVAKEDRTLRIEVGYGLEGALPDAVAKRIIDETIIPGLKQGDFAGAIEAGVDSIMRVVDGESLPPPSSRRMGHGDASAGTDLFLNNIFFVFILVIVAARMLQSIFGRFIGAALISGGAGVVSWLVFSSVAMALLVGLFAFFVSLFGSPGSGISRGGRHGWPGGFGGMGGRGGFGGGGFGGGGGGFGGGGASGRW